MFFTSLTLNLGAAASVGPAPTLGSHELKVASYIQNTYVNPKPTSLDEEYEAMMAELREAQQEAARKAEEARLQAEKEAAAKAAALKAEQERIERERAEEAKRQTKVVAATVAVSPVTFANTYVYGQCTWYVASRRSVPSNWGNANTWYARAQAAGWSTGSVPAVGAIATTTAGAYGHVALVESVSGSNVVVSEMNFTGYGGGWNIRSTRTVHASEFLYIY